VIIVERMRAWAAVLKRQTLIVYCVARDPSTPWIVRLLAVAVAAYALSPIDLIPDFIPLIGYLDDLLIVPLGIALVVRLTPGPVMAAARDRAERMAERPVSRGAAVAIVLLWLVLAFLLWRWAAKLFG
jgi:uncharacterized membrane protein YkvA (DUF1232 family)